MSHVSRWLTHMTWLPTLNAQFMDIHALCTALVNKYLLRTYYVPLALLLKKDKENREHNCPHRAYILIKQVTQ